MNAEFFKYVFENLCNVFVVCLIVVLVICLVWVTYVHIRSKPAKQNQSEKSPDNAAEDTAELNQEKSQKTQDEISLQSQKTETELKHLEQANLDEMQKKESQQPEIQPQKQVEEWQCDEAESKQISEKKLEQLRTDAENYWAFALPEYYKFREYSVLNDPYGTARKAIALKIFKMPKGKYTLIELNKQYQLLFKTYINPLPKDYSGISLKKVVLEKIFEELRNWIIKKKRV